jgi:hypothetical protein
VRFRKVSISVGSSQQSFSQEERASPIKTYLTSTGLVKILVACFVECCLRQAQTTDEESVCRKQQLFWLFSQSENVFCFDV